MKYLLNPLNIDVTISYEGKGTFTLPAEKITPFKDITIYRHMRKYLIDVILNERNIVHYDHEIEKVRQEVEKNL